MSEQDAWVHHLVAALIEFEDTHPSGDYCFGDTLARIPAEEVAYARGYLAGTNDQETRAHVWDEGWFAMGREHTRQIKDPKYPIGRDVRNPYQRPLPGRIREGEQ